MSTVIIFAISILGLVLLFLSKHRELKTGQKNFLGKLLARFDDRAARFSSKTYYRLYQLIQSIRFLIFVHLPEKGRVKISQTKDSVLDSYQKQKDVIMGKKELNGNGSSSFFLRKMSEDKNGNGSGKIEDNSMSHLSDSN